jgi:hypothetical protein
MAFNGKRPFGDGLLLDRVLDYVKCFSFIYFYFYEEKEVYRTHNFRDSRTRYWHKPVLVRAFLLFHVMEDSNGG